MLFIGLKLQFFKRFTFEVKFDLAAWKNWGFPVGENQYARWFHINLGPIAIEFDLGKKD